ncbi:leucine-rich repeat domain-containing protein [Chryseobacterium oryctis]|uniref:Leucine-rich repeat domain-containing protein n=1 Tax=Chryseobacterium oryctis TaxID=2952618 RepID=A0ABT3HL72_9FLAO|nr:leucine-rich repeat domain-containing protein [Chryseobacterium oryctis]MCW3160521.1 leucine-rich repeat domain-containing protein [Chryseobacterium oryctis]
MKTKEELRLYFENGDKPTQEHFWQWQDSYWHKDEKISPESIESIEKIVPFFINENLLGSTIHLTIPKETKKIVASAYAYTGMSYQITKVTFNEGLEIIGSHSFNSQNIKSIKTPSTLKIIEVGAFTNQGNIINGSDSIEEIVLNEGLVIIEDYAFSSSRATVKNLYIPSSVESVGQNAFAIPSLKTVSAPTGLDLSKAGIPETAIITYR